MRTILLLTALAGACSPAELAPPVAEAGADLYGFVGQPIPLDGSQSTGASFRWDTGDGEIIDGVLVEHTYAAPGRYAAVLEVTGEDGTRRTDSASVLITHPPAAAPPTRSSVLALGGNALWALLPDADTLVRVLPAGVVERRFPVCTGASSVDVGTDRLAITCPEHDRVFVMDLTANSWTWSSVTDFPRGSRPIAIASAPSEQAAGGPWVVALEGTGELAWLDVDGRITRTVAVGGDPRGLAVLPGGDAVTSLFRAVGDHSRLVRVSEDGATTDIDLAYDPGPDTDTNARGVPHLVERLAVSPDGRTLYAPGVQANTARGPSRDGLSLTFETTLRAHLSVVDLTVDSELEGRRKVFDDQGRALAVDVSPRGDVVWTAHPGTGVVHAVDAFTGAVRGSILGAGRGIVGLRHSADGDALFVFAWLDRQVHAYDLTVDPPARIWSVDLLDREPVDAQILRGKQLFWEAGDPRMGRSGYMACAHCHPDGDQDGLVWDFGGRGEGVRNTLSLRGRAGTGHGPLHWSANFDEVQDFEHDLRGPNAGAGLLSDADFEATADPLGAPKAGLSDELDALAAYVSSLKTTPRSPLDAPEGGEEAFAAAGCPECHPAPTYTDSGAALHDIGTLTAASGSRLGGPLTGLDTPTLLGAWSTPPYLHDGSAGTLREAIQAHQGTDGLDDAQLDLIVAFVQSL